MGEQEVTLGELSGLLAKCLVGNVAANQFSKQIKVDSASKRWDLVFPSQSSAFVTRLSPKAGLLKDLCDGGDPADVDACLRDHGYGVDSAEVQGDAVRLALHRAPLVEAVIGKIAKGKLCDSGTSASGAVEVKTAERSRKGSQLGLLRCELVGESLSRLCRCLVAEKSHRFVVGCSDERDLVATVGDCRDDGAVLHPIHVGPVVAGASDKKDTSGGLLSAYRSAYELLLDSAREKLGSCGEDVLTVGVHRLASSCLRLHLLSKTASRPCDLRRPTYLEEQAFVMYNYTRLAHIVRAYREDDGNAWPLPDVDNCDLSLLSGEEEWRLVFRYLFAYEDLLTSCVDPDRGDCHLNRLPKFLSDLSHEVSRYYGKTRVLLEPLPHLRAQVTARMHLVWAVMRVYEHAFEILGVEPVSNM